MVTKNLQNLKSKENKVFLGNKENNADSGHLKSMSIHGHPVVEDFTTIALSGIRFVQKKTVYTSEQEVSKRGN